MDNDISVKILKELKGLKQAVSGINKRLDGHDKRFDNVEEVLNEVRRSTTVMETDHGDKLKLLLELYSENTDDHEDFDNRIEVLQEVSNKHSIQIEQLQKSS